ncbi:MAG: acyl-CoA desaturase [Saprospiraceae bacterium]
MPTVKFSNNNAQFFSTMRTRVNEYFKDRKIATTGNYKLYTKTAILVGLMILNYIWLVFFTPHNILIGLLLCSSLGFLFAAIGFNVMHDGAHGSYSNKSWLNRLMSYSLDLLGGSSYMWYFKHNVAHHSFTNIEDMDEDINIRPLMRVNKEQEQLKIHKFQHYYGLFLYSFSYFIWIYVNDFQKYFKRRIAHSVVIPKMTFLQNLQFFLSKVGYIIIFVGIPIWQVGFLKTLMGYGLMVFVCGILIGITFQLAHVNEETEFVAPEGESFVVENEWAIHQINTTANFATKQKWHGWFWGGLNFQIEHHLFPRISHIHYPAISKIVKQTCREFNVAYTEFPTLLSAISSHLTHLKHLGTVRA